MRGRLVPLGFRAEYRKKSHSFPPSSSFAPNFLKTRVLISLALRKRDLKIPILDVSTKITASSGILVTFWRRWVANHSPWRFRSLDPSLFSASKGGRKREWQVRISQLQKTGRLVTQRMLYYLRKLAEMWKNIRWNSWSQNFLGFPLN